MIFLMRLERNFIKKIRQLKGVQKMKCHTCHKDFGDDYCPTHEKKLIADVQIGVNELGYTMAYVSCNTKGLSVCGYGTPHYSEHEDSHQDYASVFVTSSYEDYRTEEVKIPFVPKPNENYTIVEWVDKNTISIIIVPIEFVCIKD